MIKLRTEQQKKKKKKSKINRCGEFSCNSKKCILERKNHEIFHLNTLNGCPSGARGSVSEVVALTLIINSCANNVPNSNEVNIDQR